MQYEADVARREALFTAPVEFRTRYFDLIDELRTFVAADKAKEWDKAHRQLLDGPHFIQPPDPGVPAALAALPTLVP